MKMVATLMLCLTVCFGHAQSEAIELIDFETKVRVNTMELGDAELIEARSSCDGEVQIAFEDVKMSGGCAGVLERTYTLSDDCNNSKKAVQYITLEDDTPPVFQNKPEDVTLGGRSDLRNPQTLVAFDETKENVTITVDETYDFEGDDFVKVYRTWTATDMCDNSASHKITIKIPRRQSSESGH